MKSLKKILAITVLMTLSLGAIAQTPNGVFSVITEAMKTGNAANLSKHFNSSVEITLPSTDKTYSSTQANFVMKEFFSKYPPKGFSIIHKGESGSTHYATGTYNSSKGNFDTNIFVKKVGEKFLITQIRLEAD